LMTAVPGVRTPLENIAAAAASVEVWTKARRVTDESLMGFAPLIYYSRL
jgi:hypothetical protein